MNCVTTCSPRLRKRLFSDSYLSGHLDSIAHGGIFSRGVEWKKSDIWTSRHDFRDAQLSLVSLNWSMALMIDLLVTRSRTLVLSMLSENHWQMIFWRLINLLRCLHLRLKLQRLWNHRLNSWLYLWSMAITLPQIVQSNWSKITCKQRAFHFIITHTPTQVSLALNRLRLLPEARQILAEVTNAKVIVKASPDNVSFARNGATSAVELLIDCLG